MNNHPHNANADDRRDDFDHGDGTDRPAEMAGGTELDGLLRDWHETNRRAAAAGRDRLLEALRSGKAAQGPDQTETEAEAKEQRESDSATRPGQPPMLPVMPARRHSPTLRRVQGSPRRGSGGQGGGMTRFGVLIAAMLAIAVIVPQLVPSRLTPTLDSTAYAGTTTLSPEGGRLDAIDAQGEPIGPFVLKRTEVDAQVTGRFVRVNVRQRYHNPYARKIEAVYTFPLSDDGAVDRMTMTIGSRVIEGEVRERDEAREMYEAARESGRVASLLEQERANIFTQSVANIEPGAEIVIDISYIETVTERDGEFSFAFPTTVAPRYIPGIGPDGRAQVPDASRITPAYAHPDGATVARPHAAPNKDGADRDRVPGLDYGVMNEASRNGTKTVIEDSAGAGAPSVRPGNDLSISVKIDTGGPGITGIESPLHATSRTDWQSRADGNPRIVGIALTQAKEIANRDFVLKWRQTSDTVQESVFTHSGAQGNFLGVMLQPPSKVVESAVVPRELVFVLDTSGSMSGAPLDAAKRVMNRAIAGMRPVDRFNVVTFAGHTSVLWDSPRRATQENIREAMRLVDSRQGGGGTEMMKAIDAALTQTLGRGDDREQLSRVRPLRIVMFLTDGEVGNDMAIIDAIQKNRGTTRVFSFGVGNSVNRYLLNGAARAGGGAAEFVLLPRDGQGPSESEINEVVDRFTRRTTTPILTNITVEPSPNLPRFDPQPDLRNIPDVFDVTPVTILARYADLAHPVSGTLTIRGNTAAGPWQKVIPITLPATGTAPANDVLATLWARRQVESLLSQDLTGAQRGYVSPEIREAIVKIGEEFSIMSPYTSFVAVDKLRVTIDGEPQLINIPVHIPDQTNWENYFGLEESQLQSTAEYLRADKAADEDETRKVFSQMSNSVNAYSAESPAKPSATSGAAATQAPPVDAATSARGATASPPAPASPPASVASPAPVLAEIAPGGGSGGGSGAGDRVAPRSPAGDGRAERKEAASKQGPARREQQKGERATRESGLAAGAVGGSQMTPTTGTQSKGRGTSTFGRDISSGNSQDKDYRHATMTIESSPVVGDSAVGFDPAISQSELEQHDLLLQRLSALRFSNAGNEEALSLQHSQQVLPRQMLAAAEVVRNSRLAQMSQADGLDDNARANIQRSVQAVQTAPEEPLVQRWNAVASLPEQQAMLTQVAQVEREARAEFNLYAQAVNKVSPSLAAALDPEWLKANRSNMAAQRQRNMQSTDNLNVQKSEDAAPQATLRDEGAQQSVGDEAGASPSQANRSSAQSANSLPLPQTVQSIFVLQDPLLVVVLVSDLTARHIQELRSAGLEILSTSREDKVAVGRLHLEDLKRMTELAFVLRIEPAEPVGVGTNVQSPRQQQQFQKRP